MHMVILRLDPHVELLPWALDLVSHVSAWCGIADSIERRRVPGWIAARSQFWTASMPSHPGALPRVIRCLFRDGGVPQCTRFLHRILPCFSPEEDRGSIGIYFVAKLNLIYGIGNSKIESNLI